MPWRAQVVARLQGRLGELEPGARIAVCGGGRRDHAALRRTLPGAAYLPLVSDPAATVEEASLDAAVAWLVMTSLSRSDREQILARLWRALRAGGTLIVVDHNRPRRWWPRLENVAWCAVRGIEPIARPAYPVAREVRAAGFGEISLRFAFGERLQVIRAVRPSGGSA